MKIVITVKDTDNVIGLKEDIAMRLEGVADIVRIDTADVVPKSEVDMSQHLLKDAWKRIEELDELCGELQKSKTEVAREIFEELERIGLVLPYDDYLELKNKYTEGNNG